MHPSSVHLSVMLYPPKPLGRIKPNLLHHFPSWFGCARATLFFSVSIVRVSVCLSRYLFLNHWAEFNQTCYITSLHGKDVREQHFFSYVSRPSICPSRNILKHWAEFNQTCYITSPHGKSVRDIIIFPCIRHLSPISSLTTGQNSTNLLHHFPSW